MEQAQQGSHAQMRAGEPARPPGSGVATIVCQEKLIPQEEAADVAVATNDIALAEAARLPLRVRVVDVPPAGRVPEHHHGGPTNRLRAVGRPSHAAARRSCARLSSRQTMFEPSGSVHHYAENLSLTEPAKIMLITVHDEGARLNVFH